MAYNRVKHIKEMAASVAEMNGISIEDFDAEDIAYIGDETQCCYADVAEILNLPLPKSLGPVSA
jgi:hypothetical protein